MCNTRYTVVATGTNRNLALVGIASSLQGCMDRCSLNSANCVAVNYYREDVDSQTAQTCELLRNTDAGGTVSDGVDRAVRL
jgi:hypothetical protein